MKVDVFCLFYIQEWIYKVSGIIYNISVKGQYK